MSEWGAEPLLERISGPYRGYYMLAYAVDTPDGVVGYAKVCEEPIEDGWSCDAVAKLSCEPVSSANDALNLAEMAARRTVRALRWFEPR